jgi:3-dehydroquinate dehydratase / shikimate dehydrogenase
MKLCLSIAPTTTRKARSLFRQYSDKCDIFEVRIDHLHDPDLKELLRQPRSPVIITNRRKSENGNFCGTANEQFSILSRAIELGADYIDVEISWGIPFVRRLLQQNGSTKIICSYHNLGKTPHNIEAQYTKMLKSGAPILKIVPYATDITDNEHVFKIIARARKEHKNLISFCMGDRGQLSRLLAPIYGSYLTYASRTNYTITAPGQLSLDELNTIYRIQSRTRRTKLFGLVGNPVHHSRGIYFHNARFKEKKIDALYLNFWVDDLPRFLNTYQDRLDGFSVTMPFKEAIVPLLDSVDNRINGLNTVNTVIRHRGKLIGYNTDLLAVERAVQRRMNIRGKYVVILGTGAMAKTMAYAMVRQGALVTIAGRSLPKASTLAQELKCVPCTLADLRELSPDIIMNGTPVGMNPHEKETIVPKKLLRRKMVILDVVYSPAITRLMEDARDVGCRIIPGTEIFEQQAIFQSKMFIQSIR